MSERRVVVTGLGTVSPVGIGVDASWDALVSGRSGVADITLFDTTDYEIHVGGEVKDFDATQYMEARDVRRHDRNTHFAVAATGEALRHAGLLTDDNHLTDADPDRFGELSRYQSRTGRFAFRPPTLVTSAGRSLWPTSGGWQTTRTATRRDTLARRAGARPYCRVSLFAGAASVA